SAIGGMGRSGSDSAAAKGGSAATEVTALVAIGSLGRTTELVVSFDGLSSWSESIPDVAVQPARHKTVIRAITLGVRIWTCTQEQNRSAAELAAGQSRNQVLTRNYQQRLN